MAYDLDVYHILKTFAARNKLYTIDYTTFARAIQRQAKGNDQSIAFYRDLSLHPDSILVPKLLKLQQDHQVSLVATGDSINQILLPEALTETVQAEYQRLEENPDIPFPDEDSLKLPIPTEWVQAVSVETDLPGLVELSGDRPVLFYRVLFPEGLRPILILAAAAGDKLLEYAVLKIRNYLRKGSNRDYIQQRMNPAFPGKEMMLKDALNAILVRPVESLDEMRQGMSDFNYSFWAYLSSAIRKDLVGKGDPNPDDIAAMQSLYILDVYNNLYKSKTQRGQDRETAFNNLATLLRKTPYLFAMQDVYDFRDTQGHPLLGKYSREELEEWIQERTTQAEEGKLPEILIVNTGNGRSALLAKDRFIPFILKLLKEARSTIKAAIIRDWRAILYDFEGCEAMHDDRAFRTELSKRINALAPMLASLLATQYAPAIFAENQTDRSVPGELDHCFGGGKTAPPDVLLDLDRKGLLVDVRILLPIWYTFPVFSWFIGLFKRSAARKTKEKKAIAAPESTTAVVGGKDGAKTVNTRALEFSEAAKKAERRFLPQGNSLDEYLQHLNNRWNTLIEPVAKANLTEDVNSLVRDYLRGTLRSLRPSGFTAERIETMAANLADTPNLTRIRNHAALEEYIRLYMILLLKRR
jgi:hypothetical protein